MPQLDILTNLGKWGQVIAFKVKTQKKYLTVTVSIDFNKWALTNWNNRVWTAPFGGMPAVIMDISKSVTNNVVYNAENPTQFMLSQLDGALAFKIIQDHGHRKLIAYFDTWASLDKAFNTDFNFKEFKEAEPKQEFKCFAEGLRWTEIEEEVFRKKEAIYFKK
ncbi:hypothetical protein RhiirA5_430198 [Rhizophagus irregularis]|uniref:Uncharacterized protein n=1 Tax=Rhizophagus irregularis TaxID=588596 RepID=A0A2N0NX66_9GLOM|nr:hypothetical protein RhiirA5_430198 [Rhizophagus irregularis]